MAPAKKARAILLAEKSMLKESRLGLVWGRERERGRGGRKSVRVSES